MREKKYANILDDYPEEIVSEIKDKIDEEEKEEKLSLTRELKFKELQEAIDSNDEKENKVKENNEISSDIETEKTNDEVKIELIQDEIEDTSKKDSFNEDIYLTSSFKPFRKRFRLRKIFKVLFSLILLIVVMFSLIYFLIIPLYNKFMDSKPKAIFDASLTYVGKQLNTIGELAWVDSDVYDVEYILDFDTNIEEMKILNDNEFGVRVGVDSKKDIYETSLFIQNDNNKHGYKVTEKDNSFFYKFTTSDSFIKDETGKQNIFDYSAITESLNSKLDIEDYKYYVNTNVQILKDIITADMLVAEKDVIEINGKEMSVTKNSLSLDNQKVLDLEKKYNEKVLNDEKLLKIESLLNDISVDELKETLLLEGEYNDDYSLVINIYTIKGNKFVGFDVEEDGFRNIYYYGKDGDFELHLNLTEDEECKTGNDCAIENNIVIDLIGVNKNDYTNVDILFNDSEIGTLKVRSFNYESIDLSYKLFISDIVLEGYFKLNINKEKEEYNARLSFEFNNQYFDIGLNYKIYTDSVIGYTDLDKIINYTDDAFDEQYGILEDKLKELDMLESFEILVTAVSSSDELLQDVPLLNDNLEITA